MSKVKEIKGLCGGILWYAAQAIPPIDAEIGQKVHLWMETSLVKEINQDTDIILPETVLPDITLLQIY